MQFLNKTRKFSKYKSQKTRDEFLGKSFDSKLEYECFRFLQYLQKNKNIKYFMMQSPFYLVGGVKYCADFQVFLNCGTVLYLDVKGVKTQTFINKKKQVECMYPIEILILTKSYKYEILEIIKRFQ